MSAAATPILVTGMHRSGTSMIARTLRDAGVYLGADEDLVPAAPDNPAGFFEHVALKELGEDLLARCGGAWDHPPTQPPGADDPRLLDLVDTARAGLDALRRAAPWGWKDPRASLALPFWRALEPDLAVVVCVRNPLEVALSLKRRNQTSPVLALALWEQYNRAILETTAPHERVVTHYGAHLERPGPERARLLTRLGLDPDTATHRTVTPSDPDAHPDPHARPGAHAGPRAHPDPHARPGAHAGSEPGADPAAGAPGADSAVEPGLRHNRVEIALADAGVASSVIELYRALCAEAEFDPGDPAPTGRLDRAAVDLQEARGQVTRLERHVDSLTRERAELRARMTSVEADTAAVTRGMAEVHEMVAADSGRLADTRHDLAAVTDRLARLQAQVDDLTDRQRAAVEELEARLEGHDRWLAQVVADQRTDAANIVRLAGVVDATPPPLAARARRRAGRVVRAVRRRRPGNGQRGER